MNIGKSVCCATFSLGDVAMSYLLATYVITILCSMMVKKLLTGKKSKNNLVIC
jgi:sorbitol-specific phosphotransferase system component IIC